jgi:hypothetical protein
VNDSWDVKLITGFVEPLHSEGLFTWSQVMINAMYRKNFEPKIFTDITTPDRQLYIPLTGKVLAI